MLAQLKKEKLKDQNQQPKDESKLNTRERTNTPDNSQKSISEIYEGYKAKSRTEHNTKATSYVINSIKNVEKEGNKFDIDHEDFTDLSSFNADILDLVTNVESMKKIYDNNLQEISQTKKQLEETKNECETLQHRHQKLASVEVREGVSYQTGCSLDAAISDDIQSIPAPVITPEYLPLEPKP
ncbi:unnamed protein product [Mytilus edulis]|uniref:Uncharacterized protein n=1 Tax=Mytilus edulis TaxID=6550 RepID=A0A8S3S0G0_MYTED|nr:unnamed protein product [Mytilus edulis]